MESTPEPDLRRWPDVDRCPGSYQIRERHPEMSTRLKTPAANTREREREAAAQCSLKGGCTQAANRQVLDCKNLSVPPSQYPVARFSVPVVCNKVLLGPHLKKLYQQKRLAAMQTVRAKRAQFHAAQLRFTVRQQSHVSVWRVILTIRLAMQLPALLFPQ